MRVPPHRDSADPALTSASRLHDARIGQTFDYSHKRGVEHTETLAPAAAPAWIRDREILWNAVTITTRSIGDRRKSLIFDQDRISQRVLREFANLRAMQITLLQAKLHRVTVTGADLNYEGSCGIDKNLLEASGIRPFQYIELYNVSNGERFSTYVIEAESASGDITLNGAAARKAQVGDPLIICAYAIFDAAEASQHKPTIILVDSRNRIKQKLK